MVAALIPFLAGFSSTHVFYIRDLSLYFWGRHLWLRRTLWSGEWPLWDPYVGAGQAAVADALHQMFLLPVLAIRLIGSEVLGFNLWVALPFPLAVLGVWLFFRPRFTAAASALGAIAFTLSGPVVSTGNFPNMSWSVAAMPWVLWATDRLARTLRLRDVAILALTVAFQALAGEPVTLSITAALALGLSLFSPAPSVLSVLSVAPLSVARLSGARLSVARLSAVVGGLALGGLLSAIQLLPMVRAASAAERSTTIVNGVWSLHPVALVETVAPHLFGDYFMMQSLSASPWMPLVNTGREPFFYSLYFGVPLLALAIFGLVALGRNGWGVFWAAAGGVSIVLAFGVYTPVYPFLRDHLPIIASFRFPVKYLVVFSMAVAAGAAAGWDLLSRATPLRQRSGQAPAALSRARIDAVVVALVIGVTAALLAAAAVFLPDATAARASAFAVTLGDNDTVAQAGKFMLEALPQLGMTVAPVAYAAALFIFVAAGSGRGAQLARYGLFAVIATDLVVRSLGLNPVFDARHLAEPEWISRTKADPQARFYVGGKKDGTLDSWDQDAARAYFNPPGLRGSASRAALNNQAAFYPSAWHGREMLSYDLAVLWPKLFDVAQQKFFEADDAGRDLFLKRTGVRYRVLPARVVKARTPLIQVPYFVESSLYDFGPSTDSGQGALPRASIVPSARVVSDPVAQVRALFKSDWDARTTVLVDRETEAAGDRATVAADVIPAAAIEVDKSNRMSVRATVPAAGGYLLLLDSYSDDWRVFVDGQPATLVRANGLFRAVRLNSGSHVVDFAYRPRVFFLGAALSGLSAVFCLALVSRGRR
jgi:hypothetical protein